MTLALIAVFTDDAGQVQIRRRDSQPKLFLRFPTSAGIRRFAYVRMQLAAARTPQPAIRLLRAFEQQDMVALIEAIKQRGDFVGKRHWRNVWANQNPWQEVFQGCLKAPFLPMKHRLGPSPRFGASLHCVAGTYRTAARMPEICSLPTSGRILNTDLISRVHCATNCNRSAGSRFAKMKS